jgi:hypothetical protein
MFFSLNTSNNSKNKLFLIIKLNLKIVKKILFSLH